MTYYLTDISRKLLFSGTEEECLAELKRLRESNTTYRDPLYVYDEDNYKSVTNWKPPRPTMMNHFITVLGTDIVDREVASYTFNTDAEGSHTTVKLRHNG